MVTMGKKDAKNTRRIIYEYVREYITIHMYAPTYREIADGCNIKSVSTVKLHVDELIKSGYLETDCCETLSPRAIRIPGLMSITA